MKMSWTDRSEAICESSVLRRLATVGLAVGLSFSLEACSFFLFDDDELEPQHITIQDDGDGSYPNLSTVPDEVPYPSPELRRVEITKGLIGDRDNAVYTEEALTAHSAAAPPAEPPWSSIGQIQSAERTGLPESPLAPPPPSLSGAADSGAPSPPPAPEVPRLATLNESGAAPAAPVPAPWLSGQVPQQPVYLHQIAFQQEAAQAQRMQQLAQARQQFDHQARLETLRQQQIRDQMLQQQAQQRDALRYQQLAGALPPAGSNVPPIPPQVPDQQAFLAQGARYAATAPVGVAPTPAALPSGQLIGLIFFGHGSTSLDAEDRQVLQQIIAIQRQMGRGIRVVGHASARTGMVDPAKHQVANFNVSLQRANNVAAELVRLGAGQGQVQVVAMADSVPVYHEFSATGEAGNRRVEIYLE